MAELTLDDLLQLGVEHANRILIEMKEPALMPTFHLVVPDQPGIIIAAPWENEQQKYMCFDAVCVLSEEKGATLGMIMTEAWMLALPPPAINTPWHQKRQLEKAPRPSESPDRIEVVQLVATDGTRNKARMLQMVRDKPGGKIVSLVEMKIGVEDKFSGRMIDGLVKRRG